MNGSPSPANVPVRDANGPVRAGNVAVCATICVTAAVAIPITVVPSIVPAIAEADADPAIESRAIGVRIRVGRVSIRIRINRRGIRIRSNHSRRGITIAADSDADNHTLREHRTRGQ